MSDKPRTEPSADLRLMASQFHQLFVALRDEGFTEKQALVVIGEVLRASFGKGGHQ